MKVIAINGSPRANGNTALALKEMAAELSRAGIETEILHVGNQVIRGCLACGACGRNKDEKCIVAEGGEVVNGAIQKMKAADAVILGSPVHYANIGGTMKSFCDRVFYVVASNGGLLAGKPATSVVAVRRSGGSNAWSALNYYLTISNMPVAGSTYWSVVHGAAQGEAAQDAEGLQTARNAARNIAMMLQQKAAAGVATPEYDRGAQTNFIR